MRLQRLFSATLGLLCLPFVAQGADLLSAYRQAAQRDPLLAQAQATLAESQENIPLARAALLPRINAAAGISRHKLDITGFGPPMSAWYTGNTYSVTLTQPLFNGQTWVALRAARADIRGAQARVLATQQDLILHVTQAYFGILKSREDLDIATSERARLQTLLKQAEAFLKGGTGEIIAVREAQARLSAADSAVVNADNALRLARQQLFRLTQSASQDYAGLAHFEASGPQPADVKAWIHSAEQNQPLLNAAREQSTVAREQVEIARRARWPTIGLNGGYVHSKGGFLPDLASDDWSVGVNVAVNLYDGGENAAKVRQARAREQASTYQVQNLNEETRLNVESAFLRLQDSLATLKAAEQQVQSAQISLDATRKGREIGTRTNVDVLNAVQGLASAQRNLSNARYAHLLARISLKYASGVLTEEDINALNAMLAS